MYVTMWGISGLINYNLAVNLLCVSLNTFRRERNFIECVRVGIFSSR